MTTAFNPAIQIPHPKSIAFAVPEKKKELDEIIKENSPIYIFAAIILIGLAGAQFAAFHVGNVNGMIISGTAFGASIVTIAIFAVVNSRKGTERLEKFEEKRFAQDYSAQEILQFSFKHPIILSHLDQDNCCEFLFFLFSHPSLESHTSFFDKGIYFYIRFNQNPNVTGSTAPQENQNFKGTKWMTIKNRALELASGELPSDVKENFSAFLMMIESGLPPAKYYRGALNAEAAPERSED